MATPGAQRSAFARGLRALVPAFRWHALAFVIFNGVLQVANFFGGGPWWAFWPLLVTSFALAVHYLFYKALAVDDRWVAERVEELNLKSYDRSHIEDLKSRYDPEVPPRSEEPPARPR
jgi:hypothetical protein